MMKENVARTRPARKPTYNIRVAANRALTCAGCGKTFTGGGPVGHRGRNPVCDLCLLDGSPQLGMVMALISVTRSFASLCAKASEEWLEPLRELGFFARVYETFAAKSGPMRIFRLPDSGAKGGAAGIEGAG